jgi:hypothetical protein
MKLHRYDEDALVKRLNDLSAEATPGMWQSDPKRLEIPLSNGMTAQGPIMSYLVGNHAAPEGMKVSLGSERLADHYFVVALVNAWRAGRLYVQLGDESSCENCDSNLP